MNRLLIPADGHNPYADHPGFEAGECPLRYTVTHRGPYGKSGGAFGCEMTGGHCVPGDQCAQRRKDAAAQDARQVLFQSAGHD
jgi:hypothetical protein